jgi:hypothetical protein
MNKTQIIIKNSGKIKRPVLFCLIIILIIGQFLITVPAMQLNHESVQDLNVDPVLSGTRAGNSTFSDREIFSVHGGSLAGGLRAGNFDADKYSELIVVGGSSEGRVNLIDYNVDNDTFDSELLWWDPNGGLIDVTIGEVDGLHAGPEILVGGFSGNLTLLYYDGPNKVNNITIWNATKQSAGSPKLNHIFGIAVADLDDRYSGSEIVVLDAATYYLYILTNNNDVWSETRVPMGDLPRSMSIGDFDISHDGDEILVMCVNGTVYKVALDTSSYNWTVVEIFKDTNTPFSAVIDDFNTTHTGNEIIMAGLSNNTIMFWGSGDVWYNRTLWRAPGGLEGVAYGDFDHLHDGSELCITGYSKTAVMLYETGSGSGTGWKDELIYDDPDPLLTELNGVLIIDYTTDPGLELIIIGSRGKVRMLTFEPPDFSLSTPSEHKTLTTGEFTTFQINLNTFSGYSSKVMLNLTGLPPQSTFNLSRSILEVSTEPDRVTNRAVLTIETSETTPAGNYTIFIKGTGINDDRVRFLNLSLGINPIPPVPDFILIIQPITITRNVSLEQYYADFKVWFEPLNSFDGNVIITIDDDFINSPEVKNKLTFSIPIHAENADLKLKHSKSVELDVEYYEEPDVIKNGDETDGTMHQRVGIVLMIIVIIVLLLFMFKRMREITKIEQKRRSERKQQYRDRDPRHRKRKRF